MAFLKRVFSSDYRRGLSAEAAGDYLEAARAYALAGERGKVGAMHLLSADKAKSRAARLAALRDAARWGGEESREAREVLRKAARGLWTLARESGLVTEGDRALAREAAELLKRAGEGGEAGAVFEQLGDDNAAADAYQAAGEVEKLEDILSKADERARVGQQLRRATELYRKALARGARGEALERLRECAVLEPEGHSALLADELAARRITSGVVSLRLEPGRPPLVVAGEGAFPVGIGREPGGGVALRDPRISRRHAEILDEGGAFCLRDAGSRNGTRLGGLLVEGTLPLPSTGEIGLGDAVTLGFLIEGAAVRLEVLAGADRGLVAWVIRGPLPLPGRAVRLRFSAGVPLVEKPDPQAACRLRLDGVSLDGPVELCHGDHLESTAPGSAGGPLLPLDVE